MPLSPNTVNHFAAQWPHTSYEAIRKGAEQVCADPDDYVTQGSLGICGPVAVLHALASTSKQGYLDLVDEVYKNPEKIPQDMRNEEGLLNKSNGLTVLLSTYLTNQENHLLTYHATAGKIDLVAGGMLPENLKHWLQKFFPEKKVQTYTSYFYGAVDNARTVNKLWETSQGKPLVIAVVNAACLEPESHLLRHKLPSFLAMSAAVGHFIQITTPFTENAQGEIEFEAFNWGSLRKYQFSNSNFKKMLLEIIVAH